MNLNDLDESLRSDNPCWKGYHPVGTKKKGGRTVPNCVPESEQGVAEGFSNDMSTEDMIAYLRQHHDKNLHQDYLNHLTSTNSKFVLKNISLTSIRTELSGLDRAKVEQYKKMDFSKAPPIVVGSDGNILDGYHRATVAKALGIPTIKAYVGVKGQQGVAEGAPIVVAQAPIDVRNPKKAPQPYRNQGDIVPDTKPPSTEKRGVKGRAGQRPMPDQGVAEGLENYNGIQLSLEIQKDDEFVDDDDTDNQTIFVQATANGRELGQVVFAIDYDAKGMILVPQDLEVDERFRSQGIAATMYDYVKSKGYRIHRSSDQTPAGAGFWDKHKPGKDIWEQGVAEGADDTVGFSVNSERAYQAVMARFGDSIDHDETSGTMYVPARVWPQVEMVAFDADGEGAVQADDLDEGEKVGNMDADEFDAAMARLKKLAGAGPTKTVWDPVKRVYRVVPVKDAK